MMEEKQKTAFFVTIAGLLARKGFHVFPLGVNSKEPAIKGFPTRATGDLNQIDIWGRNGPQRNVAISTSGSFFGALLVIDVDDKDGRNGSETILRLEMEGYELPATFTVRTPSGGWHYYFLVPFPVKQGVDTLGSGVDTRSKGGYVVGPGSVIDGKTYEIVHDLPLAKAPEWLLEQLQRAPEGPGKAGERLDGVDPKRARRRAIEWLQLYAPVGTAGNRNNTAFFVAARLKDFGCDPVMTLELMLDQWECDPPAPAEDLEKIIANAFKYAREAQGSADPGAAFTNAGGEARDEPEDSEGGGDGGDGLGTDERGHPFEELNRIYAYVVKGDFILKEVVREGLSIIDRLSYQNFQNALANRTMLSGDKVIKLSKGWMEWAGRREYERLVFKPGVEADPHEYNIWRGFSVEPAASGKHPAVDMLLDHILKNACGGDAKLAHWLVGFLAHMVQKPGEKPRVALVFQGGKGVGKTIIMEIMEMLFPDHAIIADEPRYLVGNFNSHFEGCLLFVADEASWGGDKRHDGKLKGLITGKKIIIERKGFEPYTIENLTRIVVIGNERWLVPATEGERRYAVFSFGNGKKQDDDFFGNIIKGMRRGGLAAWLRYLLDFDLATVDVNRAPMTKGLLQQQLEGLNIALQWWHACISEDSLLGGSVSGRLPERIPVNRFDDAYSNWLKEQRFKGYSPTSLKMRELIREISPELMKEKKNGMAEVGDKTYAFFNPGIKILREQFAKFMGQPINWESDDND
jgi:Bifunctional DNA primase/polymerase, N-terminal/Family of unknown function (DUF5906)